MVRFCSILLFLTNVLVWQEMVSAQAFFHKTIDSIQVSNPSTMRENPTGGYIVIAESYPPPPEMFSGIVIISYDACNRLKWSRTVHEQSSDLLIRDLYVTDVGEILIAGYCFHTGVTDMFFLKLDPSGATVFFKKYATPDYETIYAIGELAGGGYFLYGMNSMVNVVRPFVIKTDESGNVLWGQEYDDAGQWPYGNAIPTSDGDMLMMTGYEMYKLDPNGNIKWSILYQDVALYFDSRPVEVDDGYVIVHYSTSRLLDTTAYLYKVGLNGELLWTGDRFPGTAVKRVIQLNNGHFVASSDMYIDTMGSFRQFVVLTELDQQGRFVKQVIKRSPDDINYRVYDMANVEGHPVICGVEEHLIGGVASLFIAGADVGPDKQGCIVELPYAGKSPVSMEFDTVATVPVSLVAQTGNLIGNNRSLKLGEIVTCADTIVLSLDLGNDTTLCPGEVLTLEGDPYFSQYLWSTGETSTNITVDTAGEYHLTVTNGCDTLRDTIRVDYYPETIMDYEVTPRVATTSEKVRFISYTRGDPDIRWDFSEGTSTEPVFEHRYDQGGRYPVIYGFVDKNGCFGFDTTFVDVEHYCSLYIPKAFTADENGLNDVFKPIGEGIRLYHIEIFNRWGERMYLADNEGWNGKHDGRPMPVDDYYYEITVEDACGAVKTLNGLVTLIR